MMKKLIYISIVCIVIGLIGFGISFKVFGLSGADSIYKQKKIDGQTINQISIESNSVDVHLLPTSGHEITATVSGKMNKNYLKNVVFEMKKEGDTAKILIKQKEFFVINFGFNHATLNIKVPKRIYNKLSLHSSSGDIKLDNMRAQELELIESSGDCLINQSDILEKAYLKASSGDLMISKSQAKHFRVISSSGDVVMNNTKGSIESESTSGDIALKNHTITGNVITRASSGDVTMIFHNPESLALNYRGSSGDGVSAIQKMNYQEKSEHRIIGKTGGGKYLVHVRTSSGDFYIK